jgi:tRNA threonylcarbamoyladenosine biosynthesis protein TsaE
VTEIITTSPELTLELGKCLGELLQPGDFVALEGDLGAGKTQFVRGVVSGAVCSHDEMVSSPTFTLLNEYRCRIPIYHFDLYRLSSAEEIIELGFDEYFFGKGASLVEWPDRLGDEIPLERLELHFSYIDEQSRSIEIIGVGERHLHLARMLTLEKPKKMF